MSLLGKKDLAHLFSTSYFYEKQLIYVIDPKTRTYRTDRFFSSLIEYATYIRQSYLSGQTIVVKGLENYSDQVSRAASQLGAGVNAHLYLTKTAHAASFDFHQDDRDVYIHMIYGQKVFELKFDQEIRSVTVDSKNPLFIAKGIYHRAYALGETAMISFGLEPLADYPLVGGLELSDFDTNQLEI